MWVFEKVNVWIIMVALSMETIFGNAMVIAAYKLERNISKQISNRFIVSLAVSDLIIGIEGYPLFTLYVLNGDHWPLGWIACQTWLFLDYTLCLVSILTVLLITADRYLSVCHTASYIKWQSPTKAQITIVCSWLIPALIFGFMIYGWSLVSNATNGLINGECAAPFLTNPYVNMGMEFIKLLRNLKKASAKNQRQLALLFSQRLGTQVGLKLMLSQSHNTDNGIAGENVHDVEHVARDNNYRTFTTSITNCTALHPLYRPSTEIRRETIVAKKFSMKWLSQIKNQAMRNFFSPKSSLSLSTTSSVEILNLEVPVTQDRGPNIPSVTLTRYGSTSRNKNSSKQSFLTSRAFSTPRSSRKSSSFSNLNIKRNNVPHFFSSFTLLQRNRKQTKAERRAHKAFRTITFIVGCFAILWSPYYVVATVYGFCRHCVPSLLYTFTYYMCYLNSSSNPFAYALANRQFRIAFSRMLRGDFSKNP
ncbi:putative muscarinic acetylcholine receptor gar-2 [Dirofilaria immitis]|nr:putative muscarinic acetylcholine receptor gar-2 [Dirofilaria immitis]